MTGDGGGRQSRRPDVLDSVPGARPAIDPAAIEELRSGIADIRRDLAARAEPPTRAVEAVLEDAVRRLVEARPPDAGTGEAAAIASRADGMETAAARMEAATARMEAAAVRMEAAAGRTENGLKADLKGTAELLAGDPSGIRTATSEINSAAARIEEGLEKLKNAALIDIRWLDDKLDAVKEQMGALKFGWRAFLSPWTAIVLALGMLIESQTHLLDRWL